MLEKGTYHLMRTGCDETGPIKTYWFDIAQGPHKGESITIQSYEPLNLKPLQWVTITIE